MSLYRRGKARIYWFRFEVNGHEYRGSTRTGHRRTAERIEADARGKVALGIQGVPDRVTVTFQKVAEDYLRKVSGDMTGDYLKATRRYAGSWISLFGDCRLSDITTKGIEAAREPLRTAGRTRSTATVNRHLQTLRHIFNVAREWGLIDANPAAARGCFCGSLPRATG